MTACAGLMVVCAACSDSARTPATSPATAVAPPPQESAPQATTDAPPSPPAPQDEWALVRVQIVDLEGRPLPHAAPVATAQANAFEKPVVVGEPANEKGFSSFRIPPDQRLYIRGWDFSLQMFANNFYDVYPGPVMEEGVMKLVMVMGGTLRAELVAPDGAPAADQHIALMLYHPTQGAWWPADAKSNSKGEVVFGPVPAGIYTLKLKAGSGAFVETGQITIQPGGFHDLGQLSLSDR